MLVRLLSLLLVASPLWLGAQMQTGPQMRDFDTVFGVGKERAFKGLKANLIAVNAAGCIYFPGEQPELTFQLENLGNQPLKVAGRFEIVAFATKGVSGDIWRPQVVKLADLAPQPVELELPAKGWANFTARPAIPETKGGYALVLDLGDNGREFMAGLVRTFAPTTERLQFPHQSLDYLQPAILDRLGIQAVRMEWGYVHTQHRNYTPRMADLEAKMAEAQAHKVTVAIQFGGGDYDRPLPPTVRQLLNDKDTMVPGKGDMCWQPKDDADFEEYAYRIACKYGWPKGPVTGFMLWNEPWEGVSISGWGADMQRYRAIYDRMWNAAQRARKDAGVDILVGGCDSSSNAWDKLFPDGTATYLPKFDFVSIHYQGMSSPCLYPAWNNRREGRGRVLIWDTESWVANTDDRVAGTVASNRAAGYDRALGIFYGNVCTQLGHNRVENIMVRHAEGKQVRQARPVHAWPPAAAVGAVQHFIGERSFREILFRNGLPWVYVFDGAAGQPDDGTLVVLGDLGELFSQPDTMLFRGVRSLAEVRGKAALRTQLAALPADSPERAALEKRLAAPWPFTDVSLALAAPDDTFALYDFYGNPLPAQNGRIVVPLDARGFFLRANPARSGSFARLIEAVRQARIDGLQPVEIVVRDFVQPLGPAAALRVQLTNVLNRPVAGQLAGTLAGQVLPVQAVSLAAGETRELSLPAGKLAATVGNAYPLELHVEAGADGRADHFETMRVNLIAHRTITVDGQLDDWQGCLPQPIVGTEAAQQTLTEAAWLPFQKFDPGQNKGLATAFLAWDNQYFYFAAKIADESPDPGTLRFATRNDDDSFYPETVREVILDKDKKPVKEETYHWPADVPRYSYRMRPILPDGRASRFDNVQLAFNCIPPEQKDWLTHLPGRMPKFVWYKDSDYEYALNTVAPQYGGGFEVWRLQAPGMGRKHFYPRQPKGPRDGAVAAAKLIAGRDGNTRLVECAIPWTEIPEVKALLDAGRPLKFSYAVNDNSGGPVMELAKGRSVSRRNAPAFHPDWSEHWANEVEFGWER